MSCKIELIVAEFQNTFVIQIIKQDLEYTQRVAIKYPGGVKCDGWTVHTNNFPDLYIRNKRIHLRGSKQNDNDWILLICDSDDNAADILPAVLAAIKSWATILDENNCKVSSSEKYYKISY
jgi:hypothetical protein